MPAPGKTMNVSAHVLLRVVAFCERRGHEPDVLCQAAGVSYPLLRQKEARVPLPVVEQLCLHALAITGDEHFGLHLAEDVGDASHYDIGVLVLMASATLGDAFARFAARTRYWGDGDRLAFLRDDDGLTMRSQWPGEDGAVRRHSGECAMAELVLGARVLSGQPVTPVVVRFAHDAPRDLGEHERIFACPLAFAAEHTEVVFDARTLDTPMQHANAAFLSIFEQQLEQAIARLSSPARTSGAVRNVAQVAMCNGGVSLKHAARVLGMSARTLQRRLHDEGTSFAAIVDATRHEMALAYLAQGLPLAAVAELLGYAETSAFHHAFRRWTGTSPIHHSAERS
jgi:AraC-like DNA-binding protein